MQSFPISPGIHEDAILMVPPKVSPVPPETYLFPPVPCTDGSVIDLTKAKVQAVKNNLDNPEIKNKVSNKLAEKVVIDELEFSLNVSNIPFNEELENFLSLKGKNSTATKNGYKDSVQRFVKWCQNQDVPPLEVTVHDVDRYQGFLDDSGFSNKSVRTFILGVSSFYTFLLYRYPKVFKVNPFTHRDLPRDKCKNPKDYPTKEDIKALKKEFSRIGRKDLVCVVDILSKYGFRVGSFSTLHIDKNGRYTFFSKGSEYPGQFTKTEHRNIIKYNVLDLTVSTIKTTIKKYVQKLYKVGGVSCDFSVHDIRRHFINEKANKCRDFREFKEFSRTIHKNINTTMGYCS
jgi:hypothetical protein